MERGNEMMKRRTTETSMETSTSMLETMKRMKRTTWTMKTTMKGMEKARDHVSGLQRG